MLVPGQRGYRDVAGPASSKQGAAEARALLKKAGYAQAGRQGRPATASRSP